MPERVFPARCKELTPDQRGYRHWRLICHHCGGLLGYTREPLDPDIGDAAPVWSLQVAAANGEPEPPPGRWYLQHERGYYRVASDTYRIVNLNARTQTRKTIGRRPLPVMLQPAATTGADRRGIVGQFPALPAVVVCECGRANSVAPPPCPTA